MGKKKKTGQPNAPETAGKHMGAHIKPKERKERSCFFLNSKSAGGLVLRCIILLLIPYAYLFLCGLVFDKWLKLYRMTPFIFWSLIVLYVIAIAVIVLAIVRFVRLTRGRRKK